MLFLLAAALKGKGDTAAAKQVATAAADWNALSNTYGYVRTKARAIANN